MLSSYCVMCTYYYSGVVSFNAHLCKVYCPILARSLCVWPELRCACRPGEQVKGNTILDLVAATIFTTRTIVGVNLITPPRPRRIHL